MGTHEGRLPAVAAPDAAALLRVPGAEKRFRVGEYLLRQGEPADHVLLLRTGLVKVLSVSPAGGQTILALRGPGQLLGELGSIDGAPRSAAVIALEPVVAHSVSVERFRTFLRTEPEAAFGLWDQTYCGSGDAACHSPTAQWQSSFKAWKDSKDAPDVTPAATPSSRPTQHAGKPAAKKPAARKPAAAKKKHSG
jgi:hypothetical protein